jgi:hypothetical protein
MPAINRSRGRAFAADVPLASLQVRPGRSCLQAPRSSLPRRPLAGLLGEKSKPLVSGAGQGGVLVKVGAPPWWNRWLASHVASNGSEECARMVDASRRGGSPPGCLCGFVIYGAPWMFLGEGLKWHSIATLATWGMTLVIQRAEHRDTQAIHAKLDEQRRHGHR